MKFPFDSPFVRTVSHPRIWDILIYAAALFLFVLPVLRLFLMSFSDDTGWTLSHYVSLLHDERAALAFRNTLLSAVSAAAVSTAGGVWFAFLIAYTNVRFKKVMEMLVLLPFLIPAYVITLSWTELCIPAGSLNMLLKAVGLPEIDLYSMGGIIAMLGICHIPLVYINVIHMLRKIPPETEWAARASGYTVWQTMRKINLAQVMPAVMGGTVLAFLADIDNFAIPAFLGISSGIPVLSTYIYEKVISMDPNAFYYSAALSVVLSILALSGTAAETFFSRRRSFSESMKEDYSIRIPLSSSVKTLTEWTCLAGLICFSIIPLAYMALSACLDSYTFTFSFDHMSGENYLFILTNDGIRQAAENSLWLAAVSTAVCLVAGTAVAYRKVRGHATASVLIEKCASMTYAIPGIVLALALIFHWVHPLPGIQTPLYGTYTILVLGYVTRYLILQIKGSSLALLSVDPSMEEAARISGSSSVRLWIRVMLPLLAAPVLSSAFFIFISSLTELTLSSIMSSYSTKTIGLAIFNLQQSGDYGLAAAFSSVILLFIAAGYAGWLVCHAAERIKS